MQILKFPFPCYKNWGNECENGDALSPLFLANSVYYLCANKNLKY